MKKNIKTEQLHTRLLSMAKDFHNFCQKYNITYYMLGGTALGARRHQGFIPWDDDIDLGVPREDYDKLLTLAKNLPPYLEFKFFENTNNSPMHFIKLIDNRTTLIEKRYKNYIEGLYIDIFPLDGAQSPINNKKEVKRWKKIWFLHAMVIYHCQTLVPVSLLKKIFRLISRSVSLNWLHKQISIELRRYSIENVPLIANYLGAWGKKEIMAKEIFGKPILYKFEDTFFYGPSRIDEYLTHLYGDFMKLPPKEKRVFKHDFFMLDFHTPYKQYERRNKCV